MIQRLFLFLFAFLTAIGSRAQPTGPDYQSLYRQAEKWYNLESANERTDSMALEKYLALTAILEKNRQNDTVLFNSYYRSGILLSGRQKTQAAIRQFLRSIKLNASSPQIADSLSFLPWLFAGTGYYDHNNPDSALFCYRQAERIYASHPGVPESERLFNKLGVLYYDAGDFRKSIAHFSKALSKVDSMEKGQAYLLVNYKNNIASAYRRLQENEQAIALYKSLLPYGIYTDELLHNIGISYLAAGDAATSLRFLNQVNQPTAAVFNDRAKAYLSARKADSAGHWLQRAMKLYQSGNSFNRQDHAKTFKLIADLLKENGRYQQALDHYQQALLEAYPLFSGRSAESNPEAYKGLYDFYFIFDILSAKAHCYKELFTKSADRPDLIHAYQVYRSLLSLAGYMEQIYGSDESKLFLKKKANESISQAVLNCLQLYNLTKNPQYADQAFRDIENLKASVLQGNIQELELASIQGMPKELLQKQHKLRTDLARMEQRQQSPASEEEVQQTILALSAVQQQLQENTAYRQLRVGSRIKNIETLQRENLSGDQMILSYFMAGDQLIIFYITADRFDFTTTPVGAKLRDGIDQLRGELTATGGGTNASFDKLGKELYQELITPVTHAVPLRRKLIIIPYNELAYIPFELLTDPNTHQRLIENRPVSYLYSANFITKERSPDYKYEVLAMAPFTEPSSANGSYPPLPASGAEISQLPGSAFLGKDATKSKFLEQASRFAVLHLATHAVAGKRIGQNSFIRFFGPEDGDDSARLTDAEIYGLNLQRTRLAVLSACETGAGELVNSEGIISLSRAFSYAGCRSVITSLWKADDVATAYICQRLHQYLRKGLAIDEALQKAKLDYLKDETIEARFKKPSYWANLVLTGDPQRVNAKGSIGYWIFGILVLMILAIGILKKTRNGRRPPRAVQDPMVEG